MKFREAKQTRTALQPKSLKYVTVASNTGGNFFLQNCGCGHLCVFHEQNLNFQQVQK